LLYQAAEELVVEVWRANFRARKDNTQQRCLFIGASFGRIVRGKAPLDRPIQFFSGLLDRALANARL
jgi:hypothetical protein